MRHQNEALFLSPKTLEAEQIVHDAPAPVDAASSEDQSETGAPLAHSESEATARTPLQSASLTAPGPLTDQSRISSTAEIETGTAHSSYPSFLATNSGATTATAEWSASDPSLLQPNRTQPADPAPSDAIKIAVIRLKTNDAPDSGIPNQRAAPETSASSHDADTPQQTSWEPAPAGQRTVFNSAEEVRLGAWLARTVYGDRAVPDAWDGTPDDNGLDDNYRGYLAQSGWTVLDQTALGSHFTATSNTQFMSGGLYQGRYSGALFNSNWEAQAILVEGYLPDGTKTLALAFRGTDGEDTWDASVGGQSWTGNGQYEHYQALRPLVNAAISYANDSSNGIDSFIVSGHSLGGSMVDLFTTVDAQHVTGLIDLTAVALASAGLDPDVLTDTGTRITLSSSAGSCLSRQGRDARIGGLCRRYDGPDADPAEHGRAGSGGERPRCRQGAGVQPTRGGVELFPAGIQAPDGERDTRADAEARNPGGCSCGSMPGRWMPRNCRRATRGRRASWIRSSPVTWPRSRIPSIPTAVSWRGISRRSGRSARRGAGRAYRRLFGSWWFGSAAQVSWSSR